MNLDQLQQAFEREADLIPVEPVDPASLRRRATAMRARRMSAVALAVIVVAATAAVAGGVGRKDSGAVDVAASDLRTAHVKMVTATHAGVGDPTSRPRGTETVEGDFDFGNKTSRYLRTNDTEADAAHLQATAQVIERGGERWSEISDAVRREIGTNAHWQHLSNVHSVLGDHFDPYDGSATARAGGDRMTEEGRETIDGVNTTRYRLTALTDASARTTSLTKPLTQGGTPALITTTSETRAATVWIDDSGRLRRLHETYHTEYLLLSGDRGFSDVESTLDVLKFGVDVGDVEIPIESDVISMVEFMKLMGEARFKKMMDADSARFREECLRGGPGFTRVDGTAIESCPSFTSDPPTTTTTAPG